MVKDDFLKSEYEQCRSSIENSDTIIADIRLKGITLVLAFDGAAALSNGKMMSMTIWGHEINAATVIQLTTFFLLYPVYVVDNVYTEFLVTAVNRAMAIEKKLSEDLEPFKSSSEPESKLIPPLTTAITNDFTEKFKKVARVHEKIYWGLGILSLLLFFFYATAK